MRIAVLSALVALTALTGCLATLPKRNVDHETLSMALPTECPLVPSKDRERMRSAAIMYLAHKHPVDWCYLYAQQEAESAHRPDAVSPVGAQGVAQIMPETQREICEKSGICGSAFDTVTNTNQQAYYMARLSDTWSHRERTWECKRELAAASYNAGLGNVLAAQAESGDRLCWRSVAGFLDRITGSHATETIGYIRKINSIWKRLRGNRNNERPRGTTVRRG